MPETVLDQQAPTLVRCRIRLGETLCDERQTCRRTRRINARRDTRHDLQGAIVPFRYSAHVGEVEWNPKLRPQGRNRKVERRAHHTDHGISRVAQHNLGADDCRITAEATPPESLAENHDRRARGWSVAVDEGSPDDRLDAERGEQVGRAADSAQSLGLADVAKVATRSPPRGNIGKDFTLGLQIEVDGARHRAWPARAELIDRNQLLRRCVRKCLEQHGANDGEDRGVGADSEREAENRDDARRARVAKRA